MGEEKPSQVIVRSSSWLMKKPERLSAELAREDEKENRLTIIGGAIYNWPNMDV